MKRVLTRKQTHEYNSVDRKVNAITARAYVTCTSVRCDRREQVCTFAAKHVESGIEIDNLPWAGMELKLGDAVLVTVQKENEKG